MLLSERDIRAVLTMPDLIEAMERALAEYSAGKVTPVSYTHLTLPTILRV